MAKKKCETCKHYENCNHRKVIVVRYKKETVNYINPKNCKDYENE